MGCSSSKEIDDDAVGGAGADRRGSDVNAAFEDQADLAAALLDCGDVPPMLLQLSLACRRLPNTDVGSLTDSFVVISERCADGEKWSEIARTEIKANDLDPNFVTLVPVTYRFEQPQKLRFEVYDVSGDFTSSNASDLKLESEAGLLGSAEAALAQIVGGARDGLWTAPLAAPAGMRVHNGQLHIRAEEVTNTNAAIKLRLRTSMFAERRTYLLFSRLVETATTATAFSSEVYVAVFRTEVQEDADPMFNEIECDLRTLANGDALRPLRIQCFRHVRGGAKHKLLGTGSASIKELIDMAGQPRSLAMGVGRLSVTSGSIALEPSFLDYIRGGVALDFIVAIDFTSSNGNPSDPSSLHYRSSMLQSLQSRGSAFGSLDGAGGSFYGATPTGGGSGGGVGGGQPINQYAAAISGVGAVLQHYDTAKRFKVYGFGGRPDPHAPPSHCFPLNGDEVDPSVSGVGGILDIYRRSLDSVTLSGPTLFAPVVQQASAYAADMRMRDGPGRCTKYYILLILTDGVINDEAAATEAIVAAADLPFSVIIIGVGRADFAAMERLDGDAVRLTNAAGRPASRDIVQFVPMRDFLDKGPHAVAREVLAEVPGQILLYMKQNGVAPGRPVPASVTVAGGGHGGGGMGGATAPPPPPQGSMGGAYGGGAGANGMPVPPPYTTNDGGGSGSNWQSYQ